MSVAHPRPPPKQSDAAQSASDPADPLLAIVRACKADGRELPPDCRSFRGVRWIGEDLSGLDLSGCDFSGAELSRSNLSGCRLVGAVFASATLYEASLDESECLSADFSDADLSQSTAQRAGFGAATLTNATLFGANLTGATFTRASLNEADLRGAQMREARLLEATLVGADLSRADLARSDLDKSNVDGARFLDCDLRDARLRGLVGYARATWIEANITGADFCGAYLVRRTIMDENYLHEFRSHSRLNALVFRIWSATSDCGRSFFRWGLWTVFVAVLYAGLYRFVALDTGSYETFLSPLYYSVVTLTTLGYGDIVPASPAAQLLAMSEVVFGYVMLGGLLSIFANKMARRAD